MNDMYRQFQENANFLKAIFKKWQEKRQNITMTKEQKVKIGDWVILTDPINNGQIVCVTDVLNDESIVFDGGITRSYKVFNGEFISIPNTNTND